MVSKAFQVLKVVSKNFPIGITIFKSFPPFKQCKTQIEIVVLHDILDVILQKDKSELKVARTKLSEEMKKFIVKIN